MSDSHQEIKTLEISLHQQDIRRSKESLELLLHPLFKEVGYSGVTYDLKSILEALEQEAKSDSTPEIWSQNFEFIDLASEIVQVLYLSAHLKEGVLVRHAKRTSIWVKDNAVWKMQYHQATPTSSFKKSYA